MCGVAGLFAVPRTMLEPANAAAAVQHMLGTLVHRGPDASGAWSDPRGVCHLGHRRLSIIDTSNAGLQPMIGGGGRWVVSFNGEIYNFLELRPQLEALGVPFKGRTDTEVLIEAVAAWGAGALPRLDGQFAFAAFDALSGDLLLARDPFGEKPLYYIELPEGGLAFASELQALETLPFLDPEVSVDAVSELLMFQYIGAPRTIYRTVKKLPPGHWLLARAGRAPDVRRYFDFAPGRHGFDRRPIQQLADEAEDILLRSLKRRMISDVPLGAFLSGGVDSSTACALIRKRLQAPLKTFSIGFTDTEESEHETARIFARHLGTDHYDEVLEVSASDFLLNLGAILDEPNADSSCLPTYLLSGFARKQVTVAISGDGGDELFCGYDRYFATLDDAKAAKRGWSPGHAYYSGRILVFREHDVHNLLGFIPEASAAHLVRLREEIDQDRGALACTLRRSDVNNYMPGAVLAKVDRMSLRHSLEVRTPYLSTELARFAERLPLPVLYGQGRGKLLLKAIGARYLPRELLEAPKRGFGLPMSGWGRDALLSLLQKMLEPGESRLAQMIGADRVGAFVEQQQSQAGYSTYHTWAVCTLESWLRHHRVKLPQLGTGIRRAGKKVVRPKEYYAPPKPIAFGPRARWYCQQLVRYQRVYGTRAALSLVSRNLHRVPAWIGRRLHINGSHIARRLTRAPGLVVRLASRGESNETFSERTRKELYFYLHGNELIDRIRKEVAREDVAHRRPVLERGDRVLLVTHALPPGGAERQWCYLAIGLKRQGYDVAVALIEEPRGNNGHYLPLLIDAGIEVHVLRRPEMLRPAVGKAPVDWASTISPSNPFGVDLPAMIHLLNSQSPKAVLAQLDYPNLLAASAALLSGVPQILLSFRNYNPSNFSYLRNDWFLPFYRAVSGSQRVVLSGNSDAGNRDYAEWIGVARERVARIPNAIEIAAWNETSPAARAELRSALCIPDDAPVVLGVFRLSEEKRPLDFIEVSRKVLARVPEARFLIVGHGAMRPTLEACVRTSGIEKSVLVLGRRSDVSNLLSVSSLLLHTPEFEGMPNVIMEAQAMGRPVVATRAGATAEIVQDGKTGLLADVGDIERLAEYCCDLLRNRSLAESFGTAARVHVAQQFGIAQLAQRHVDVLNHRSVDLHLNTRVYEQGDRKVA